MLHELLLCFWWIYANIFFCFGARLNPKNQADTPGNHMPNMANKKRTTVKNCDASL